VLAAFLGRFLDAFDQVALLLVLPAIGKEFGVSLTLMGLVITAQSLGRIVGNVGWGWLADRYGRRLAFMAGVIWFAACSGLTGLAWTYAALVVIQFFFGIGFGGEWTASAALLMESVPARARAVASSLMMSGYEVGFFAASGVNALLVPRFGWRALFFVGIAPALLAIFIRLGVGESPVWLQTQAAGAASTKSEPRRFRMNGAAWQACLFMAALQFMTASLYSFYPTLLETVRRFAPHQVFAAIAAYSIGSILGKLATGRMATRFGHRRVILSCLAVTIFGIVPFAAAASNGRAMASAFVVGASSSGIFALVPHYLSLRFANAVRSFGMGLAYALAALAQAIATSALPSVARTLGLAVTIEAFVVASSLAVAAVVFYRPPDLPSER
jgi:SHS family lactate transporter-like MFS transporter